MHLHEYHNEDERLAYWSQITEISQKQFYKTYHKPNTGKSVRKDYPGCIAVKYYDVDILRKLNGIYEVFPESIGA